jgi:hypothetical protein
MKETEPSCMKPNKFSSQNDDLCTVGWSQHSRRILNARFTSQPKYSLPSMMYDHIINYLFSEL